MNTFFLRMLVDVRAFSRSCLTSSIPRFDAASISITSIAEPSRIEVQAVHVLHGSNSPSFLFSQFTEREMIRAMVVLPTPRGPANR